LNCASPFPQLRAFYEVSTGAITDVKGSAPVMVEDPSALDRVPDKCGVPASAVRIHGTNNLYVSGSG
jgi:hypothetical protein